MTQKRARHGQPVREIADALPTPERSNHGLVERLERTISNTPGRPARPYRFVDTLAVMERRGSITAGMRQAGEDFRDCFAVAQLDPLSAFDISRPKIGGRSGFRSVEEPGSQIENARRVVWRATLAVGGLRVRTGKQSGPRIGMRKGTPHRRWGRLVPVANRRVPRASRSALTSDGAARVGGACLPTGASRGGTQARCLKRQLSLPVSMISQ